MKRIRALLALLAATLPAIALAAAAAPQHLDYEFRIESAMPIPGHGGVMRLMAQGVVSFNLVAAKDNLYTYSYIVNLEELRLTGFPGNDTQASQLIRRQLQQGGNMTVDYSQCRVGRITGNSIAAVAIYCDTQALEKAIEDIKKSFQAFNINVSIELKNKPGGKEVVITGKGVKIRLVYGDDGVLREYYSMLNTSVLAGHAIGGYNILEMRLAGYTRGAQTPLAYYAAAGIGVAAAAAAAAILLLRRKAAGQG